MATTWCRRMGELLPHVQAPHRQLLIRPILSSRQSGPPKAALHRLSQNGRLCRHLPQGVQHFICGHEAKYHGFLAF